MKEPNRILVVDDSDELRDFFALVLEQAGYLVDTANSGAEGLQKVRSERPDLIVLDVVMPGMDGFELLLKVRSDLAPPVPPVILCSGFDVTQEEALRRGATRFLRKPVDVPDLLLAVADTLAGRPANPAAIARERAHVSEARRRASAAARKLLARIAARDDSGPPREHTAFEYTSALARYLGADGVALALLDNDRLLVTAAAGTLLWPGCDLGEMVPPALAIIETGSSLVLPDIAQHPSFGPACEGRDGICSFIGVPLLVDQTAIGVLCVVCTRPVAVEPEDLSLVLMFADGTASILSSWARGRPDQELPTRFGPGIVPGSLFESMLDAELRLLGRKGGSLELAILHLTDLAVLREALGVAVDRERLGAGVLAENRVALFRRSADREAGPRLASILESIRVHAEAHAAGIVDLTVAELSPLSAHDLIRVADLGLDKTLQAETGGLLRFVIDERHVSA